VAFVQCTTGIVEGEELSAADSATVLNALLAIYNNMLASVNSHLAAM
jgi:hypothetical protein